MNDDRLLLLCEPEGKFRDPFSSCRIAYLLSQYPAVSHTFILNEIQELRKLGFQIATASINCCDRAFSNLPPVEQTELSNTLYVKAGGWSGALNAAAKAILQRPLKTLSGLAYTMRLGGSSRRFFYFVEALIVGAWMDRLEYKHLHVHFGGPASSVALIAAQMFSISLSLTIHGPEEFYDVYGNYLAEKLRTASFICCIGHFARSQLMKLSPVSQWGKLKLTPLGVDLEKFLAPADPRPRSKFEILCVGRLVPAKGQHILLLAFAKLIREGRATRLHLVGDGPDRMSIERWIALEKLGRDVVLHGAIGSDQIPAMMQQADVLALPSFAEGIPIALMEGMASELACLSTTVAGIPELIRNEVDGLLVSPSDDEALAQALRRLMDEPGLKERLGKAGRVRVAEHFNLSKNVAQLATVFRGFQHHDSDSSEPGLKQTERYAITSHQD